MQMTTAMLTLSPIVGRRMAVDRVRHLASMAGNFGKFRGRWNAAAAFEVIGRLQQSVVVAGRDPHRLLPHAYDRDNSTVDGGQPARGFDRNPSIGGDACPDFAGARAGDAFHHENDRIYL